MAYAKKITKSWLVLRNQVIDHSHPYYTSLNFRINEKDIKKYVEREEIVCSKCGGFLETDCTDNSKFYCRRCDEYGIGFQP